MTNNIVFYIGKISFNFFKDIVYFPLWWYTRGLFDVLVKLKDFLINRQKGLALWIWMKNILRPMYGQWDWIGFLISFFLRLFQIAIRSIAMIFWLAVSVGLLLVWVAAPIFIIYQIYFQMLG